MPLFAFANLLQIPVLMQLTAAVGAAAAAEVLR